jgi:hypothetical protein
MAREGSLGAKIDQLLILQTGGPAGKQGYGYRSCSAGAEPRLAPFGIEEGGTIHHDSQGIGHGLPAAPEGVCAGAHHGLCQRKVPIAIGLPSQACPAHDGPYGPGSVRRDEGSGTQPGFNSHSKALSTFIQD